MQLKPEILTVLNSLGATSDEIDNLTSYFGDQLINARANVEQIDANMASMVVQKQEAEERVTLLTTAIGKFIVEGTDNEND